MRPTATAKGNGTKMEEGLNVFKFDKFDADAFVNSNCTLNDKEIRQLCSYLLDLKRGSAEETRKSVNLLSTQATLIHGLAEGVHIDSLSPKVSEGPTANGLLNIEDREPSDLEKWSAEFPDLLDILLAEKRVDEALASLDEGEHAVAEAKETNSLSPTALASLQTAIIERKQKLADQLAEATCQPSTRGVELCAAISALKKLGDGPHAYSLLLNAHFQRYRYNMLSLRPSSTSYGGAYIAALSQLVFSAIGQAATDSLGILVRNQHILRSL
ncbi:hypothetical protein REPUB_Repub12eG0091100 [Reevesia pubescens]